MNVMAVTREREEVIQPNAIIIIGAGLRRMMGEIVCSIQSGHNVEKAIHLMEKLRNKNMALVFSGGFFLDSTTEAKAMNEYVKETYPEIYNYFDKEFRKYIGDFDSNSAIYLETQSRNSYDNIKNCLNLAEKNSWRSIIMIDQPMHILQLRLLLEKELRKRKLRHLIVDFVPAEPVWGGNDQTQWSSPIKFFVYEILSTGYYLLKGKIL